MTRRTEGQIIMEILMIARIPSRKTWIVYQANLNFKIVGPYLEKLIDRDLLKEGDGLYVTTEKGLAYIGAQAQIEQLLGCEREKSCTVF